MLVERENAGIFGAGGCIGRATHGKAGMRRHHHVFLVGVPIPDLAA